MPSRHPGCPPGAPRAPPTAALRAPRPHLPRPFPSPGLAVPQDPGRSPSCLAAPGCTPTCPGDFHQDPISHLLPPPRSPFRLGGASILGHSCLPQRERGQAVQQELRQLGLGSCWAVGLGERRRQEGSWELAWLCARAAGHCRGVRHPPSSSSQRAARACVTPWKTKPCSGLPGLPAQPPRCLRPPGTSCPGSVPGCWGGQPGAMQLWGGKLEAALGEQPLGRAGCGSGRRGEGQQGTGLACMASG